MKKALFIGRFQPFHKGHEWLFRQKLDKGIPLLIAIRDVPPDDKNPFTPEQAAGMIRKVFDGSDVTVIIIPDIESVNWGRGVGYETNEFFPPVEIGTISATQIRNGIAEGTQDWKNNIDSKIWDDILSILSPIGEVLIRYNTTCEDDINYWRVLIGGVEHTVANVKILCNSYTSENQIAGVGTKWHIACKPKSIDKIVEGDRVTYILS